MGNGHAGNGISFITAVPEWFLALAGLVYATGFLIVFTYFESFGIQESGAEFFKVKYVHVGILCTMFVILLGVPCFAYRILWHAEATNTKEQHATESFTHVATVVIVLNMLLAFYGLVMFAPRGYVQKREFLIPFLLLASLLFLALMRAVETKVVVLMDKDTGKPSERWDMRVVANIGRWFFGILGLVLLDWYSFRGLGPTMWEMLSGGGSFKTGGYVFVIFILVMIFLLWRATKRILVISDRIRKVALWAITGCLLLATYYLAVLSFAYSVYPYIPVDRGGGSFVDSPKVTARFRIDMNGLLPSDLLHCDSHGCFESIPLVLIEETSTDFFIASPTEAGGVLKWRLGERPRIYNVRRELVNALAVESPPQ
jgi:hypothetical protein